MALSPTAFYFDLKEDPGFTKTLKRSQLRRVGPNTTDLWTYQYAPLWIDSSPRSLPYANEVIGPRTLNTQEQRVEQVNTWVDISAAEKRARILGIAKGQIPDWTPKELIKDPFREIDLTEGAARWHTMETALAATDDADLDAFDTNLDNHIPDPGVVQRHIIDTGENDGWAVGSIQMSILATPPGPLWRLADGSDCTGTAYATATGDNKLPDLRGAYLRMAGRNASHASWDGDVLGTFQADSTAMPNIPFHIVNDGDHKHSLNMTAVANPNSKIHYTDWTRVTAGFHTAESPGDSYGSYWTAAHSGAIQTEGDHSHHFDGGDAETRPKTYSVNYFIKVNQ